LYLLQVFLKRTDLRVSESARFFVCDLLLEKLPA
jgi:hypothetical protein